MNRKKLSELLRDSKRGLIFLVFFFIALALMGVNGREALFMVLGIFSFLLFRYLFPYDLVETLEEIMNGE